jgi:hypothetical protein
MALNPPLGQGMIPFRVDGEHFCLQRDGVEFELKIHGMGTLKGAGKVVVTTMRLILINPLGKPTFKAFDLPLVCRPLNNSLPGDIEFKIWFTEGGC